MNWLTNTVLPKIRALGQKKEVKDNLWTKCPSCAQMVFQRDLDAARRVCPHCGHHMRLSAKARLEMLFDDAQWSRLPVPDVPMDPLKFRDSKRYSDRMKEARAKSDVSDAMTVGLGRIGGHPAVVSVQDFAFMGGSMGLAVGEAFITAALKAVSERCPLVVVTASGGARMQEGILSLMQMPRSTVAVQRLREAGLPYIVVLTDPTSGGVTASYAMLGDIHIAEPGAFIGFAGPRVIEQTIRETLPQGFQRAEYLLEHGMLDMVVHRHQLKETLARLIGILMVREQVQPVAEIDIPEAVSSTN